MFTPRKQLFVHINGYVINNSLMCSCWEFHWHIFLLTYVENIKMYSSVFLHLTSSHSSGTNWKNCIQMEIPKNFQLRGCTEYFYVRRSSCNSAASSSYSSGYRIWKKNINVTESQWLLTLADQDWCSILFCYDIVTIPWFYTECCKEGSL